MRDLKGRFVAVLALAAIAAAFTPFRDLDVDIPRGTPFDTMKLDRAGLHLSTWQEALETYIRKDRGTAGG